MASRFLPFFKEAAAVYVVGSLLVGAMNGVFCCFEHNWLRGHTPRHENMFYIATRMSVEMVKGAVQGPFVAPFYVGAALHDEVAKNLRGLKTPLCAPPPTEQ